MVHTWKRHLCGYYWDVGPPMIMGLNLGRSSTHDMQLSREMMLWHSCDFAPYIQQSADSSACWDQSQPTKTSRQSWPSRLSIHVRKFNPTDSRHNLLSGAIPVRFFSHGGGRRGWAAVHPASQSTRGWRLFANLNEFLRIETIFCEF